MTQGTCIKVVISSASTVWLVRLKKIVCWESYDFLYNPQWGSRPTADTWFQYCKHRTPSDFWWNPSWEMLVRIMSSRQVVTKKITTLIISAWKRNKVIPYHFLAYCSGVPSFHYCYARLDILIFFRPFWISTFYLKLSSFIGLSDDLLYLLNNNFLFWEITQQCPLKYLVNWFHVEKSEKMGFIYFYPLSLSLYFFYIYNGRSWEN